MYFNYSSVTAAGMQFVPSVAPEVASMSVFDLGIRISSKIKMSGPEQFNELPAGGCIHCPA